jgi:peptidoglycan/LPS O-acetylase OafA/YrhL
MLLGIGLHAALSFYPTLWPVTDIKADIDGFFDEFVLAVHGFRMPLFFLLSGFFTALLWRRRGLSNLLWHRMRRLVLPFILGVIFIVPTVDWVSERAIEDQIVDSSDIHSAVFLGNLGATQRLIDEGVDIDAPAADGGYTPVYLAAVTGAAEILDLLIANGADPNIPAPDGMAVDAAAYFGHRQIAEALVAAGSYDPRAAGTDWQDLPYWAQGTADEIEGTETGIDAWLPNLHHLWFLWFLILFVLLFAPFAWLAERLERQRAPDAPPARWPLWAMLAIMPLVLVPQLAMEGGGAIPAFGPDTSIGWVPIPNVFLYYALFFGFGVLMFGRVGRSGALIVDTAGRRWWLLLPIAAVVFVVGAQMTYDGDPSSRGISSALQVLFAWLMIFGLMGLFRTLLSVERYAVRYLSDSSYWQYLWHLTLVIALQAWVRTWDVPALLKFGLIVITTSVALLITYQLLVRYTVIGTMLNGKRTRPTRSTEPSS